MTYRKSRLQTVVYVGVMHHKVLRVNVNIVLAGLIRWLKAVNGSRW